MTLFESAVRKLELYGTARNRDVDPEVREVTITDDEAVALLARIREGSPDGS